jgi:hypothetical protein
MTGFQLRAGGRTIVPRKSLAVSAILSDLEQTGLFANAILALQWRSKVMSLRENLLMSAIVLVPVLFLFLAASDMIR